MKYTDVWGKYALIITPWLTEHLKNMIEANIYTFRFCPNFNISGVALSPKKTLPYKYVYVVGGGAGKEGPAGSKVPIRNYFPETWLWDLVHIG